MKDQQKTFNVGLKKITKVVFLCQRSQWILIKSNKKSMSGRKKPLPTVIQIQALLSHTKSLMQSSLAKGNYTQAQNCRISIEQIKKDREARLIKDMQQRHKEEREELQLKKELEFKQLFENWERRMKEQAHQEQISQKELQTRQERQYENMKNQLQAQLPLKVKESVQCLNLRKMEAHMVKQKNYAQAHLVQQQIAELEKSEKERWIINRNDKIELALLHLKQKHKAEEENLLKNNKAINSESKKQRGKDEEKLTLKFSNLQRDLLAKQEKEKLAHKGEFTSKGGEGSPLLTKSRLLKNAIIN